MSRFRLHGCAEGTRPAHFEVCDSADAALGIGRRLAARGWVVFAYDDRHEHELALFIGNLMLHNRELAPADNPLLAIATAGRAPTPARRTTGRRAPPSR